MAPRVGLTIGIPQSSQSFARAERGLVIPAFSMHQQAKLEHHGISSVVAFSFVALWYSKILGLLMIPATSKTPCSDLAILSHGGTEDLGLGFVGISLDILGDWLESYNK